MKAAVVGASGFLGQSLVKLLSTSKFQVTCVVNSGPLNIHNQFRQITPAEFLELNEHFDYIVFCAGSFRDPHVQLIKTHTELLGKITEIYSDSHIQFISSVNVYGHTKDVIVPNSPFNNPGLYGRAKLCGEFIVSSLPRHSIIRFTYLYGSNLNNGSFLPTIIGSAKANKEIVLGGKGSRKQDYLHVDDAAMICLLAFENEVREILLGASGTSYSNLQVAEIIANHIPGCNIIFRGEDSGQSFTIDSSKTFESIKWNPSINFKTLLLSCI